MAPKHHYIIVLPSNILISYVQLLTFACKPFTKTAADKDKHGGWFGFHMECAVERNLVDTENLQRLDGHAVVAAARWGRVEVVPGLGWENTCLTWMRQASSNRQQGLPVCWFMVFRQVHAWLPALHHREHLLFHINFTIKCSSFFWPVRFSALFWVIWDLLHRAVMVELPPFGKSLKSSSGWSENLWNQNQSHWLANLSRLWPQLTWSQFMCYTFHSAVVCRSQIFVLFGICFKSL